MLLAAIRVATAIFGTKGTTILFSYVRSPMVTALGSMNVCRK